MLCSQKAGELYVYLEAKNIAPNGSFLLQSNFNDSNTIGTMKICSRQGFVEPVRVNYRAR